METTILCGGYILGLYWDNGNEVETTIYYIGGI